jgi:hypothetical protein
VNRRERGKGKNPGETWNREAQGSRSRGVEKSQDFSQAERSLMRSAVARLFFILIHSLAGAMYQDKPYQSKPTRHRVTNLIFGKQHSRMEGLRTEKQTAQIRKLCDEALSPPGAQKRWKLDFQRNRRFPLSFLEIKDFPKAKICHDCQECDGQECKGAGKGRRIGRKNRLSSTDFTHVPRAA